MTLPLRWVSAFPRRCGDAGRVDRPDTARRGVHSNRRERWVRGLQAGGRLLDSSPAIGCPPTLFSYPLFSAASFMASLLTRSGPRKAIATILIGIVPCPRTHVQLTLWRAICTSSCLQRSDG